MNTSTLPNGTVLKFKAPTRLHSFYDRIDYMGSLSKHPMDAMDSLNFSPGDIITILKTTMKDEHVGQTVLLSNGNTKVIYYRTDTFFDTNVGSFGQIDLTLRNYFYDVM